MFAGVEILNEYNHCSQGQNQADLPVPEIQMSLIGNEETLIKASLVLSDEKREIEKNESEKPFVVKDKWGKDVEFLLSCIALSVGLGNVWRFPFTALENGGGAFFFAYVIVLIFVGRPLYYMELLLGQFSSKGCIKVYDFAPAFRGVGVGQVISTCFVTTYYASILGLAIFYFVSSFSDPLPWSQCKAEWNVSCIDSSSTNISNEKAQTSTEIFFNMEVLRTTEFNYESIGTPSIKLCVCLVFAWACIGGILIKGVRSSGKASYFLAIFPYIMMFILLIRAITLPGAFDGIKFFLTPQWDRILEAQVWYAAVTQVFYSLAVCFGSIIMYSSYNKFDQQIYRDVNIITTLDTLTSLLSGFVIFGVLGHLAHVLGVEITEVTKSNIALAFMAYPETISKFDFCPQFFSLMFFIMLFVLGIGSNIGMASCIMTVIKDRFPSIECWKIVFGIATVGILVGTIYTTPGGQYLINFLDFYGASFVALILAIVELIAVCWIYGVDRFCKDIEFMLGMKTGLYWRICWRFITPTMMIGIFVYFVQTFKPLTYQDIDYSTNMRALGWCISMFCLMQLPLWAYYAIVNQKEKTWKKKIINAFRPNSSWGPNDAETFQKYKEFVSKNSKIQNKKGLLGTIKESIFC